MNELGANLVRTLREERHKRMMSQSEFAEFLELGLRSYQRYESGERFPKMPILEHILKKLGISEAELENNIRIQGYVTPGEIEGGISVRELAEMVAIISELRGEDLEILKDTLNALSKPLPLKARKKKEA